MRLFQDAKDAGCVVQVGPCRTPPPSFSPARPGYNALYSTPEAPPTRNMLPRFLVNERERGLCVGAMGDEGRPRRRAPALHGKTLMMSELRTQHLPANPKRLPRSP
jgi:hypothetical protein